MAHDYYGKTGKEIVEEYLNSSEKARSLGYFEEYHGDECFFIDYPEREELSNFREWFLTTEYVKEYESDMPYSLDRYDGQAILDWLLDWTYYDSGFHDCDDCGSKINIEMENPDLRWAGDGWCICEECVKKRAEEYINEHLVLNHETGVPTSNIPLNSILDSEVLEQNGFELWKEDLEIGYYGTYDDPRKIIETDLKIHPKRDFICHKNSINPFATYFSIYIRDNEPITESHYTDKIYGGYYTYEEMVEDAKKNYDYGDETNFATYLSDWWKENYKKVD